MKRRPLNTPPNGGPDDEWLDVNGAAKIWFGGKVRAVRGHVMRHTLPYKKFGSRVLFSRREVERFFNDLPGVTLSEARENAQRRTIG